MGKIVIQPQTREEAFLTEYKNRFASTNDSNLPETKEHSERVPAYAMELATLTSKAGYFPNHITPMYMSILANFSQYHDIGKIIIPELVALQDIYTPEQHEKMHIHALAGGQFARFLGENNEITNLVVGMIEEHHEKWDGTGYPYGLSGEEISPLARNVALADVYDALTSDRCYREAICHEGALEIIENGKGNHFDPIFTDVFLKNHQKFKEILGQYRQYQKENRTN